QGMVVHIHMRTLARRRLRPYARAGETLCTQILLLCSVPPVTAFGSGFYTGNKAGTNAKILFLVCSWRGDGMPRFRVPPMRLTGVYPCLSASTLEEVQESFPAFLPINHRLDFQGFW